MPGALASHGVFVRVADRQKLRPLSPHTQGPITKCQETHDTHFSDLTKTGFGHPSANRNSTSTDPFARR